MIKNLSKVTNHLSLPPRRPSPAAFFHRFCLPPANGNTTIVFQRSRTYLRKHTLRHCPPDSFLTPSLGPMYKSCNGRFHGNPTQLSCAHRTLASNLATTKFAQAHATTLWAPREHSLPHSCTRLRPPGPRLSLSWRSLLAFSSAWCGLFAWTDTSCSSLRLSSTDSRAVSEYSIVVFFMWEQECFPLPRQHADGGTGIGLARAACHGCTSEPQVQNGSRGAAARRRARFLTTQLPAAASASSIRIAKFRLD